MTGIIDRFEGDYAVVELPDRTMKNIPREQLPEGSSEGTVLILEVPICIDYEQTKSRRETAKRRWSNLWK